MSGHTYIGDEVTPGVVYRPMLRFWPTVGSAVTAAVAADKEWDGVCRAAERPEWYDDPRFVEVSERLANDDELITMLGDHVDTLTMTECEALFEAADVLGAPTVPRHSLWDDPQVAAGELIHELDHPTAGRMRQVRPAPWFLATSAEAGVGAPMLGGHTDVVRRELGKSTAELAELRKRGVIS